MMGMIWLGVLIFMIVVELFTLQLLTVWFAGGALAASLATLLGVPLFVQCGLFLVVSLLLLAGTRPFALKYIEKGRIRTNAESLIGESVIVTEDVDNFAGLGQVTVKGQEWTARSGNGTKIPKGSIAEVL